jgi:hypothetical protein
MVKETHLDIFEACCSMQLKKNLEILDLSETWKKVEENCTLSLP